MAMDNLGLYNEAELLRALDECFFSLTSLGVQQAGIPRDAMDFRSHRHMMAIERDILAIQNELSRRLNFVLLPSIEVPLLEAFPNWDAFKTIMRKELQECGPIDTQLNMTDAHMIRRDAIIRFIKNNKGARLRDIVRSRAPHTLSLFEDASALRTEFQNEKLLNPGRAMLDVGQWFSKFDRVRRQVCCIEIGDTGGTGFLVGPDLVLTCNHVMRSIDNIRMHTGEARFRFDYSRLGDGDEIDSGVVFRCAEENWLVDSSRNPGSGSGDVADHVAERGDYLDYALVRLSKKAGLLSASGNACKLEDARGWLRIPATTARPELNSPVCILHHPSGGTLKLSQNTRGVSGVSSDGTRVRYQVNTQRGSSGAPCFDENLNLIAMHAGFNGPADTNEGVLVGAIRDHMTRRGLGDHLQRES